MIDFNGQVAVVTGAGRGLGRLYALDLARRGASVVVNDLGATSRGEGADASVAEQVVSEIQAAGGSAVASHESVATPEGGDAIVRAALDHYGRVDIVVNNAGIVEFTPFEELTAEAWRRMLSVNVDGCFYVSQPAFRAMKDQGYGRFVFISSSAGMFGNPGNAHYGTSKAAVFGLTNTIAIEGAPYGILANSVLPMGLSRMVTDSAGEDVVKESQFFQSIQPDLVMPLVVYLASRTCNLTHHNFASCAGRYSRVFAGLGNGWIAESDVKPSAEDIEAHLDDIKATTPFAIPESLFDEIMDTCTRLGISID